MAKELSDLPQESLKFAIDAWRRGDKSHLSAFMQDSSRAGVFFPKPAELREIAELHAQDRRAKRRETKARKDALAEERDMRENPDKYVFFDPQAILEKLGKAAPRKETRPNSLTTGCPQCGAELLLEGARLSALTPQMLRDLADVMDRQQANQEQESAA